LFVGPPASIAPSPAASGGTGFAEAAAAFSGAAAQLHRKTRAVSTDWTGEEVEYQALPLPTDATSGSFYLHVQDRALEADGVPQGSYILVDPSAELRPGRLVWIQNRDGATLVRRLEARRGGALITSAAVDPKSRQRLRDQITTSWIRVAAPVVAAYAAAPEAGVAQPDILAEAELHPIRTLGSDGAPTRAAVAIDAGLLRQMHLDSTTLRAAQVTDDAMLPALGKGAWVLIDIAAERPGSTATLWAILDGGRLLVRQVSRFDTGSVAVVALDQTVEDRILSRSRADADIYFCGRVIASGQLI
jgi:phage repressor protein C with HTH and peptisase S24 domain